MHRCRDTQTRRHTDTQTHRHADTQTHRHTDTQTHRHTDTQTRKPHRYARVCIEFGHVGWRLVKSSTYGETET